MKEIYLKLVVDDEVIAEEVADTITQWVDGVTSVYQMHKQDYIGMYKTDERPIA